MSARLARVLLLSVVLAVLGAAATAFAQDGGEPNEGGEGPAQSATPPADAKFVLQDADNLLGGGAMLDKFGHGGQPIDVPCSYTKGSGDTMQEWGAKCTIHVTVTLTKGVAKILGIKNRVIFDDNLTPPKYWPGIDQVPNNAKDEDTSFHLDVSRSVRDKLKPVGYIKYVSMKGYVSGPRGEHVKLATGSGDWGGRRTPGGIVCPSKNINLTIRPHSHAPYCPGGLGGTASPSWYHG